jgi:hypothetical protein
MMVEKKGERPRISKGEKLLPVATDHRQKDKAKVFPSGWSRWHSAMAHKA